MSKPWSECTPEEQAQRRVNFGSFDGRAAWSAYDAELLRRFHAGEPLTKDDCRRARRLLREG